MIMPFLLYHKRSRPTGKKLAHSLGLNSRRAPSVTRYDTLIRWGNADPNYRGNREINSADSVARSSNKLRCLEVLRREGVSVPNFSRLLSELQLPVFGRKYQHRQGEDITHIQ